MDKNQFMNSVCKMDISYDMPCGESMDFDGMYDKFEIYRQELIEWNKSLNLTRIVDKDEIYIKHFLDSLSVFQCSYLSCSGECSVLDVGTGAGFPGIPMKIFMPSLKVTLLDSLKKRVSFLQDMSYKLNLELNCIHGRAEDIARQSEYREKFDVVVSRAVANFATLLEYCIPFVKEGGVFIALKGKAYQDEIDLAKSALDKLDSKIEKIIDADIPNGNFSHKLIIIKKKNPTNEKYPRKAGLPTKKPL